MLKEFKNYNELRANISPEIDTQLFKPDRLLGLITGSLFVIYCLLFLAGMKYPILALPIGILLGLIAEFLSMANHDILHGSVFKSKIFSLIFCIPNSIITLISPSFWKFWHNFHHKSVDRWTKDNRPLEMGYETHGYPILRNTLGIFELFFFKIIHLTRTQVKFIFDKRYTSSAHIQLKRAVTIQCLLIIIAKIFIFIYLPFPLWLALELIPLLIQSFLSSMFLVTQHSHKLDKGEAIRTFSVTLPSWLERWFLNVGYHVEHHLFPNLPSKNLPKLKKQILNKYVTSQTSNRKLTEALLEIYNKN